MSLHVERAGAGEPGEPVLLLHSSGLSGRQWRKLAGDLVAKGRSVVIPDLTGHGTSAPWLEPRPFSFHADVEEVLSILGTIGPAHVIGHSYGGLLAMHVARRAPASIRSLAVFDPVTFGALDRTRDADVITGLEGHDFTWDDPERWLETFVDFWGGKGAWSALREELRAEFRRVGWVVQQGVTTLSKDTTPANAFAVIDAPVHVVTGSLSPVVAHRIADRLIEAIPGARKSTVDGVGHLGPVTHAAAVNPLLEPGNERR